MYAEQIAVSVAPVAVVALALWRVVRARHVGAGRGRARGLRRLDLVAMDLVLAVLDGGVRIRHYRWSHPQGLVVTSGWIRGVPRNLMTRSAS